MTITAADLKAICPLSKIERLQVFVDPLNKAMADFDISENPARETAFLAQVAHESGGFRYVTEIASGEAYEGRKDLGNTEPGDGRRFKGRGLIQLSGRENYRRCGEALDLDLIAQPELLEQPEYAAASAGWFWAAHGLNELADKDDFLLITKRINGGTNGYQDRLKFYERAKKVLSEA